MKITTHALGFALRDHFERKTVTALDEASAETDQDQTEVSYIDISDASNPLIFLDNGQAFKIIILSLK